MPVPVVESTTGTTGNSATATFTMPATRPDGDIYIGVIHTDGPRTFSGVDAGWTSIVGPVQNDCTLQMWWWVGASEPASYTVTISSSERYHTEVWRISGADTTTPINVSGSSTGTSTTATAPDVTTTGDATLVLRSAAADRVTISATPATEAYKGVTPGTTSGVGYGGSSEDGPSPAGATGTADFTVAESETWATATVAIQAEPSTTATITIGSALQKEYTATVTIGGRVQRQDITSTATIDALLQKEFTATVTIDAILTNLKLITIDALLQRAGNLLTITIDGQVEEVQKTKIIDIDALVERAYDITCTIDGIAERNYLLTATVDSIPWKQSLLTIDLQSDGFDGYHFAKQTLLTPTIDGIATKQTTPIITIDAQITRITAATCTIDANLLKGKTLSCTIDAVAYSDWVHRADHPGAIWMPSSDWDS